MIPNRFQKISTRKIDWVDIINPSRDNLESLKDKYDLSQNVLEELVRPSARQKVDRGKNYIYLVLHLPIYRPERLTSQPFEIDFILTKKALITVRYDEFEPIDKFFIACSADPSFSKRFSEDSVIKFFFHLTENIIEFLLRELVHIHEKLNYLEDIIFHEKTQTLVKDLLFIKRDILVFRRLAREIQSILDSFKKEIAEFYPGESHFYANAISGLHLKVLHTIEDYKDSIESLENTHAAVVNITMSTVMKALMVISVVTLPATLVLNILDLYYYTRQPSTFEHLIIVLTVIGIITGSFLILKNKKWI